MHIIDNLINKFISWLCKIYKHEETVTDYHLVSRWRNRLNKEIIIVQPQYYCYDCESVWAGKLQVYIEKGK